MYLPGRAHHKEVDDKTDGPYQAVAALQGLKPLTQLK